jgi:AhpD family alkylhydroperoxidase
LFDTFIKKENAMTKDYKEILKDVVHYRQKLGKLIPKVLDSFTQMSEASLAEGVLSGKTKELIALAVAVSIRCDGCIGTHAFNLHALGATREEVAQALGVSIAMGGGPSVAYAADALRAFDQFAVK